MSRVTTTSKKTGLPPGSLIHVGERRTDEVGITIIDYDEKNFNEKQAESVEECFKYRDEPTVTWINIEGLHEVGVIEELGNHFGLHPLLLEDILNTEQRPKIEDFDDHLFIILKMLYYDEKSEEIKFEHISLVLGSNFVISFQETEGDVFDTIRDRIRNGKGRIRRMGSDYLMYALIDAVVDNYFIVMEKIGDVIEDMEEELVEDPSPDTLQDIYNLKREMIFLRKSVWPLREVISRLQRGESDLIQETTYVYLRDVYDHTIQVIDTIETFRDLLSGMLDVYLSSINNRMSEIMKVLTIIATIFIPLTFIAGVYGMNFDPAASPWNMPELEWYWGYPAVLLVMSLITVVMLIYFRRRGWI